jgi:hypothetical protein
MEPKKAKEQEHIGNKQKPKQKMNDWFIKMQPTPRLHKATIIRCANERTQFACPIFGAIITSLRLKSCDSVPVTNDSSARRTVNLENN